jgi:hypothetical protein
MDGQVTVLEKTVVNAVPQRKKAKAVPKKGANVQVRKYLVFRRNVEGDSKLLI